MTAEKPKAPPCGYYSVNYNLVEKTAPINEWKLRNTKSIKVKEDVQPDLRMITSNDR